MATKFGTKLAMKGKYQGKGRQFV